VVVRQLRTQSNRLLRIPCPTS